MATHGLGRSGIDSARSRKRQREGRRWNKCHGTRLVWLRVTDHRDHRTAGHDHEHHGVGPPDGQRLNVRVHVCAFTF